jgi:glycosyltransferase involved in cell wall biosynthesis
MSKILTSIPLKYQTGFWKYYFKPYRFLQTQIRDIVKNNCTFIASSDFVRHNLKESLNVDADVIYPPVNTSEFKPLEKENYIVTISRMSQDKNLEFLFNVARNIDYNFVLLAHINTQADRVYYNSIIDSIPPNVQVMLSMPRDDLVEIVGKAKYCFAPSIETFGISVVESMSAGCIPLVTDAGALKEIVSHSELQFKHDDMKDAVEKLRMHISGCHDHFRDVMLNDVKKFDREISLKKFSEVL